MGPAYFYLHLKGKRCAKCQCALDDQPCFARWTADSRFVVKGLFKKKRVEVFDWRIDYAVCGGCIMDRVLES